MDAFTDEPLLHIEEEGSKILPQRKECCMPALHQFGRELGLSCQQIFERAYARIAHPPSFARAVFARCMNQGGQNLPQPVLNFLNEMSNHSGKRPTLEGFCAACMLDKGGQYGFVLAGEWIHPESLTKDVLDTIQHVEEISEVEKLYLNLLDSGALDIQEDDWRNLSDEDL